MPPVTPAHLLPRVEPRTVLDVGCGIFPQPAFPLATVVRLDAFRPYLERAQERKRGISVNARWQDFFKMLLDDSFDAVLATDFIEHLTRREGCRFIREAQRVGRYVQIFTPYGWLEQSADVWGFGGEADSWQTHRSAWTPDDFEGWEIEVSHGYHNSFFAVKERECPQS